MPPEEEDLNSIVSRHLDRMSTQAAIIAGFAFTGLITTVPVQPYWRGILFVVSATLSTCLEVLVLVWHNWFTVIPNKESIVDKYTNEILGCSLLFLSGLLFFMLSLVFLATIHLTRFAATSVAVIVGLTFIAGVLIHIRMVRKLEAD
jgi:hypothetical protein